MRAKLPHAAIAALMLAVAMAAPIVPVMAVNPDEVLADPALEARARVISKGLRCLVCQNQSIDDSDAGLARDLRILLRQRLAAGDSDQQAKDFLVARYGDFVLLKPPLKPTTYALWFGPGVIFIIAALGAVVYLRRRRPAAAVTALTADERKRLDEIFSRDGDAE